MSVHDVLRDLDLLVRSRYPLIVLETAEDDRAAQLLRELSSRMGVPLYAWSVTRGIRRVETAPPPAPPPGSVRPPARPAAPPPPPPRTGGLPYVDDPFAGIGGGRVPYGAFARDAQGPPAGGATPYDTTHPLQALHHVELAPQGALYHFADLHPHLDDPVVLTKLREAAGSLVGRTGAIVLTGHALELPEALKPLSATVRLPLPRPAEYRAVLREVVTEFSARTPLDVHLSAADVNRLMNALRGFGLAEARKVITRVILEDGRLGPDDVPRVLKAKAEAIARDGLLEYVPVEHGLDAVAGLRGLKAWLAKRRVLIEDPARAEEAGLPFPRGVLLLGVPGTGKSLSAKCVAADWGLPLLRFDAAALFDKYVGESEKNFRRALATAERLSPAVLWIDEVEKAFPQGGDADGGVSVRVLGGFLSWMQERRGDVFVVATANDVSRLPPELLRKGRFDEVFFVDLPDAEARVRILEMHLRRRKVDPSAWDLAALAGAAEGYSGAEIEQAVVSALYTAVAQGGALTQPLVADELARTVPLSRTRAEDVAALREWARDRAVPAD